MYNLLYFALFSSLCGLIRSNEITLTDRNNLLSPSQYCSDLKPQNSLDIDQIMGMWFGSEVLTHHDSDEGEHIYDSCVVIHLAEKTNEISTTENPYQRRRQGDDYNYDRNTNYHSVGGGGSRWSSTRYLRLIWDEKGQTLEYTLRFNNTRMGFWISSGPQHGTMLDLPYNQFTGTIQVMKAVDNQLVLTFCQNIPGNQLFSIVLSRKAESLTYEEIHSIRGLLKRRGLSVASVRKVCSGSDHLVALNLTSMFALLIMALYNFKKF